MCVCVLQSVCCNQNQLTETNTHPCESYKKILLFFVTRSFDSKSTHVYEIIRSLHSVHIPSIVSHHQSCDHRRWLFLQEHGDSYGPIILPCRLVNSSNIHQMKLHCDYNLCRMSEVVDALGNL
ncbi:hypothetical protein FGIG_04153 [Fasciola gigantica]|uniref:Uncharacterized protein n=1 Tax=Fasciola gigantica TaxID=46835 RepID=A0A504YCY2_FASGI|nr:hypothetical protein FGIG_04153 [Fasciola gigantica]